MTGSNNNTASVPATHAKQQARTRTGRAALFLDDRVRLARFTRTALNKVFPDHWSFMLGEIALYTFVVLLITGIYLTFFFDPSMALTTYHGRYVPLTGVTMSRAYASTLNISFDVRGGLLVRQIHYWAALLFLAAIFLHLLRVFFTGAFRKPRELNWLIGLVMLVLSAARATPVTCYPTTSCPELACGSSTRASCLSRSSEPGSRSSFAVDRSRVI